MFNDMAATLEFLASGVHDLKNLMSTLKNGRLDADVPSEASAGVGVAAVGSRWALITLR